MLINANLNDAGNKYHDFHHFKQEIDKHKNSHTMSPFCQKKKEHFFDLTSNTQVVQCLYIYVPHSSYYPNMWLYEKKF